MPIQYRVLNYVFEAQAFGFLVRQRRENMHMSQHAFGVLIGRSAAFVSSLERASYPLLPSLSDYLQICNALDLNPSEFFRLEE